MLATDLDPMMRAKGKHARTHAIAFATCDMSQIHRMVIIPCPAHSYPTTCLTGHREEKPDLCTVPPVSHY